MPLSIGEKPPPGIFTKVGPTLDGDDVGGIQWVPAWVWVLMPTTQTGAEEEILRAKDDPRLQVIILGEFLLTTSGWKGADVELACSRWVEKVRALDRG